MPSVRSLLKAVGCKVAQPTADYRAGSATASFPEATGAHNRLTRTIASPILWVAVGAASAVRISPSSQCGSGRYTPAGCAYHQRRAVVYKQIFEFLDEGKAALDAWGRFVERLVNPEAARRNVVALAGRCDVYLYALRRGLA
jgi:hypothetical protein